MKTRVLIATTYHAHTSNMMQKKTKPSQPNKGANKSAKKSFTKPAFKKVQRNGIREDEEIKTLLAKYPTIDTTSIRSFDDFPLSRKTLTGLQKCKYKKPTDIQQQSIGYALQGRDVLGAAITGYVLKLHINCVFGKFLTQIPFDRRAISGVVKRWRSSSQ